MLFPTLIAACHQHRHNAAVAGNDLAMELLAEFLEENLRAWRADKAPVGGGAAGSRVGLRLEPCFACALGGVGGSAFGGYEHGSVYRTQTKSPPPLPNREAGLCERRRGSWTAGVTLYEA